MSGRCAAMNHLFCMLVAVVCGAAAHPHSAHRHDVYGVHQPQTYRSYRAPRQLQRRLGIPFTGDVREETFEEYLRAQGVTFNSLFDDPDKARAPASSRADTSSERNPLPIKPPAFFEEQLTTQPRPTNRRTDQPLFRTRAFAEAPPSSQQSFGSAPAFPRQTAFPKASAYATTDRRDGDGVFYVPQLSGQQRPVLYSDAAPRDIDNRSAIDYSEAGVVYPAAEIAAALKAAPPPPLVALSRPARPLRRKTVVPLVPAPAATADVIPQPRAPRPVASTFISAPLRREDVLEPAVSPRRPAGAVRRQQVGPVRRQDVPDVRDFATPVSDKPQRSSDFTASASALRQPQAAERQDVDYALQIPKKQEKQRLEFQVHGQQGPHSYKFGYDTGTGYNRQFRFEERDGYGNLRGRYGFYDKTGKLQIVNYSATPEGGFHAEGDFGKFPNKEH